MSDHGVQIHTGWWINWSHGAVLGSTLTLSAGQGGLLTAFLAIFVSAAGAACWSISSFALHQYRARPKFQDALHHQQQLIFRSNITPGLAFWQLTQLIYYWQSQARNPLRRTLPLAILALLNLLLFALAGVFSSEVTKAPGKEALIRSRDCGSMTWRNDLEIQLELSLYTSQVLNESTNAAAYARACYSSSPNPLLCNQYTTQHIPWKVNRNASCPFKDDICVFGPTAALELDTGPLDSHDVLGINAPVEDRITYRKVTTCAPLHTRNYVTEWNDTNPTHIAYGDKFARYWYGAMVGLSNYTFDYNQHTAVDNIGYSLDSYLKTTNMESNAWKPIPALDREDADVALFALSSNAISYATPVFDPLFSANIVLNVTVPNPKVKGANITSSYYEPDYFVSPLACIDQHQFCNPNTGKCTPLTSSNLTVLAAYTLGLNTQQKAIVDRSNLFYQSIYFSVTGRNQAALRASESLFDRTLYALPNDQWMIEVSSWFAVSMARLQQSVIQYATGPPYLPDGAILIKPANEAERHMCKSQRVRSPGGTMSFSVLGVAIILVVGSILILISLFLDTIVGYFRRAFGLDEYKRLQWAMDNKFQLHRLAYEEAGQGSWSGGVEMVPTTRRGDLIGVPFQQVEEQHPRLTRNYMPGSTSRMASYTDQGMAGQKTPFFSEAAVDPDMR